MAHRYLTTTDLADMQRAARSAAPVGTGDFRGTRDKAAGGPTVHSITSTPEGRSKDMGRRMKVYTIQMALRVACFFGFVLVDNWWWRIVCVLGMVLFPWSAVLLANAGADKSERESSYLGPEPVPMLTSTPEPASANAAEDSWEDTRDDNGEATGEESSAAHGPSVVEGQWSEHPGTNPER